MQGVGAAARDLRPRIYSDLHNRQEASEKMVAYSAVVFVHLLLLSGGFLVASATVSVDGEREVVVEGRIFNITSGNDTFNLECGPECKRKVSSN